MNSTESMQKKLIVFDSHPVQYRVPIWRELNSLREDSIHVVYASDCSVRGHEDKGFGTTVIWDDPMLSGYSYSVLNCENGMPLSGWKSLTGKGVSSSLDEYKPDVVLLTGLNYRYDWVAYYEARKRNIPVWLRCETQDEAQVRSRLKGFIRSLLYRLSYLRVDRVFYIGKLNYKHYIDHGVKKDRLVPAFYGTMDRFSTLTASEKKEKRNDSRARAGIPANALVIGFSGKFIDKKNPGILFTMLDHLPEQLRSSMFLYFIGSGDLDAKLKQMADEAKVRYGVQSFFAGFVNQSALANHYLAIDILVLPSRRMGETWGLVANEAMQSGCGVITSDAVGCYADFSEWERFRSFPDGDAIALASRIEQLSVFERNFEWAVPSLQPYSISTVAQTFLNAMDEL